ncbi:hypothetical protein LQW54_012649 [Pestalotiopsis sp. IQ-011]
MHNQDALQYEGLATNVTAYGYCSLWSTDQASSCTQCLDTWEYGHQFENWGDVEILEGACKMQPADGSTLAIKGNIFSSDIVSVTTPTPTAAVAPSGPSGPLGLGGIVGVAIGGAVFVLAVLGFCIVTNGKRKRRAFLRRRDEQMKHWPTPGGAGEMFETPISQRPLRSWDESPISVSNDATYPRYFSPYSSQFNSPVSAVEGNHQQWPAAAAASQNIGVAVSPGGNQSHYSWSDRKGKDRARESEDYEMQEENRGAIGLEEFYPPPPPQAPVLSHPGYGRHGPEPPRSLTEEDFRSGRAV